MDIKGFGGYNAVHYSGRLAILCVDELLIYSRPVYSLLSTNV
jgi:hypothetical protein